MISVELLDQLKESSFVLKSVTSFAASVKGLELDGTSLCDESWYGILALIKQKTDEHDALVHNLLLSHEKIN